MHTGESRQCSSLKHSYTMRWVRGQNCGLDAFFGQYHRKMHKKRVSAGQLSGQITRRSLFTALLSLIPRR